MKTFKEFINEELLESNKIHKVDSGDFSGIEDRFLKAFNKKGEEYIKSGIEKTKALSMAAKEVFDGVEFHNTDSGVKFKISHNDKNFNKQAPLTITAIKGTQSSKKDSAGSMVFWVIG